MLSVIIPSYKDPLLHKTIDSILENSGLDEIEIIPVLDGYWPATPIKDDPRINVLHLGKNVGMRNAINAGVRIARGDYIMRTDEHCMFAPGFAEHMLKRIKRNWIMTAKRYFLDTERWEVMDKEPVEYEKLAVQKVGDKRKFSGIPRPAPSNKTLVETQGMQGSFWIMPKKWWDKVIGALETEGYGTHYQDSHEMVFKTWKAGGKLMCDRGTWFAHKHYTFPRSHNYGSQGGDKNIEHCYNTWKDYYNKLKKTW